MASQNDFNRINEHIIQPVQRLFAGEINDYAIEVIIEDLAAFPDDVLKEAMKIIRRTCKRLPSLAHILEACEEARKQASSKFSGSTGIFTQLPKEYPNHADEMMRSEYGQMALREGWGNDLYLMTQRTGKMDWNEADADTFRFHLAQGIKDAKSLDMAKETMTTEQRKTFGITMDALLAKSLWKLWLAMREKEAKLAEKYLVKQLALPSYAA